MSVSDVLFLSAIILAVLMACIVFYRAFKTNPKELSDTCAKYPESLDPEPFQFSQSVILDWPSHGYYHSGTYAVLNSDLLYPSGSPYDPKMGAHKIDFTPPWEKKLIQNIKCVYCGAMNNPNDSLECHKCGAPLPVVK